MSSIPPQAKTVARAFAETTACEYLVLAGCCLLVVIQAPAGRDIPSLWFTFWGPLFLIYEYPVQACIFLIFAGTLRSYSLLQRSTRGHRHPLRLIHGGAGPEPGFAGEAAPAVTKKTEDGEPSLDRTA